MNAGVVIGGVVAAILGVVVVAAAMNKPPRQWAEECTRLAAHPAERLPTGGVALPDIRVNEARAACEQAVAQFDRPELHYRYARTLSVRGSTYQQGSLALRHAQIAVDRGYAIARLTLADLNVQGHGTSINPTQALAILQPLLEQRMTAAMVMAAQIDVASGDPTRRERGYSLYEASAAEYPTILVELGNAANAARDYRRGLAAFQRAEAAGIAAGIHGQAISYDGLQQYQDAARLYRRAAEAGIVAAQINLALALHQARGVPKNNREAMQWAMRAAQAGDAHGQYLVGFLHFYGDPELPRNALESERYLRLAVAQNHAEARRIYETDVRAYAEAVRNMPSGNGNAVSCLRRRTNSADRNMHEYYNGCPQSLSLVICRSSIAGEVFSFFDGTNATRCTRSTVSGNAYITTFVSADENSSLGRTIISEASIRLVACYWPLTPQADGSGHLCAQ